jgi:hypothetical protein
MKKPGEVIRRLLVYKALRNSKDQIVESLSSCWLESRTILSEVA